MIQEQRYTDAAELTGFREAAEGFYPEVVMYHDDGARWEAPMTDTLRILTFAGQPVPEEGLTVTPPQGGELTIWPDGGYAFLPPEGTETVDGGLPVTTYYSFVMEDIDGSTSVGTFALDPSDEMPSGMQDFQAWSLPELLDAEADAAKFLLGPGEGTVLDVGSHVIEPVITDVSADFVSADANFEDELDLLIFQSQNS